jgi:hypothetical protein
VSYIDWSDAEAVFDMLLEYVADEKTAAHGDTRRAGFLGPLHAQLVAAQEDAGVLSATMAALREIIAGISPEFAEDPVVDHLTSCLEELERIRNESN